MTWFVSFLYNSWIVFNSFLQVCLIELFVYLVLRVLFRLVSWLSCWSRMPLSLRSLASEDEFYFRLVSWLCWSSFFTWTGKNSNESWYISRPKKSWDLHFYMFNIFHDQKKFEIFMFMFNIGAASAFFLFGQMFLFRVSLLLKTFSLKFYFKILLLFQNSHAIRLGKALNYLSWACCHMHDGMYHLEFGVVSFDVINLNLMQVLDLDPRNRANIFFNLYT